MVFRMIRFTRGNLLEAEAEAQVNTVNTVGVMGKGIALMFKEAFPENFRAYAEACKRGEVRVGTMFVTDRGSLLNPRWIINFPTKQNWRHKARMEWVEEGLCDLRRVIVENQIRSVAVPPLGCGNGGLRWGPVRAAIEEALSDLKNVEVVVFEPISKYQNVAKRSGVQELTPARALVAELVRRYWVLGIECSLLEIQKLAWFLERTIERMELDNPLDLRFEADRYGPYADRLRHLLNDLDGSYLHCERRISDARPTDTIWFDDSKKDRVAAFLNSEARSFADALEETCTIIDGFESPLGLELLATVDWLLARGGCDRMVESLRDGLGCWPGGGDAARRKIRLFDSRLLGLALARLSPNSVACD